MDNEISANALKTRGIAAIEEAVRDGEAGLITVRGTRKYVVMTFKDYRRVREFELDAALAEARRDISEGRAGRDGVDGHLSRLLDVLPRFHGKL